MHGADKKDTPVVGQAAIEAAARRVVKNGKGSPIWASGLKQLYDQVVDEPIPDSFKDLLSKLDDAGR